MQKKRSPHSTYVQQGQRFPPMGLGRLELPTSRLSDMSRALVGARERWNQGDLAESALVGARQRWPAMIQVVIQGLIVAPAVALVPPHAPWALALGGARD